MRESDSLTNFKNAFHGGKRRTTIHGQKYLNILSSFLPIFIVSFLPPQTNAFWLPPDYWVTIYRDGQIEPYRSQHDFIQFPPTNGAEYIGYWINSSQIHQEAYGHVTVSSGSPNLQRLSRSSPQFCGHFLDSSSNQNRYLCGGFRILAYKGNTIQPCPNPFTFVAASVANPFLAVEYLDTQIARIQLDSGEWIFGGAKIAERRAFAFDPRRRTPIEISYAQNSHAFAKRVEILQRSAAFPVEDLLDDSNLQLRPQPLPPIVEPQMPLPLSTTMMTTTEATEETTTTTMTTTIMSAEPEEMLQEQIADATTIAAILPETTPIPQVAGIEDYNDEELSGAGIEWGALENGNGIEEVEKMEKKKRELPSSKKTVPIRSHRRRRRRRHFRHKRMNHIAG